MTDPQGDKHENFPAPVSSASSLDTLFQGPVHERLSGADIGSLVNEALQNTTENVNHPQGEQNPAAAHPATAHSSQQGVVSPSANEVFPPASKHTIPSMMLPSNHLGVPVLPSGTPLTMPGTAGNNSIPEFLYQLTKMLTDNNRHIIEWSNGKIEVHSPHRLESEVLQKYFRHSKFASFQRQLNYFGFRKNAGKGKMAPCSYVNEATTPDLSSVLLIKRKTTASIAAAKEKEKKKEAVKDTQGSGKKAALGPSTSSVNPVLAGILQKNNPQGKPAPTSATSMGFAIPTTAASSGSDSFKAVARAAVGRGIRHSFSSGRSLTSQQVPPYTNASTHTSTVSTVQRDSSQDSLSRLASNYQKSLNEHNGTGGASESANAAEHADADPTPFSQMQHGDGDGDDLLLELAMIPEFGDDSESPSDGFKFIDFPNEEIWPKR